ncbi:MAG: hypothetical protein HZA34_01335 [Candidatus Pacebacteria bacterium]|nr:hypothetical protein [Candidatus Paceibacterota bacterium]
MGQLPEILFAVIIGTTTSDRLVFISQFSSYVLFLIVLYMWSFLFEQKDSIRRELLYIVGLMPMAVLQANSVQTDLLSTFLFLTSVYFLLKLDSILKWKYLCYATIAGSLSVLCKDSLGVFLLPFILWKSTFFLKKEYFFQIIGCLLISIFIVSPLLFQRFYLFHSLFPISEEFIEVPFLNSRIEINVVLSNVIRNLFFQIPIPFFSSQMTSFVAGLHTILGINMNDPGTTWPNTEFMVKSILFPHEDLVGNPFQILLSIVAGFLICASLLRRERQKLETKVYLCSVSSFILFSALFRWQPWHSRLLLPILVVMTISAILVLSRYKRMLKIISFFSVLLAFILIFTNSLKPYISYSFVEDQLHYFSKNHIRVPLPFWSVLRADQYYTVYPEWKTSYRNIAMYLEKQHAQSVYINIESGFIYPFWIELDRFENKTRIVASYEKAEYKIISSDYNNADALLCESLDNQKFLCVYK